MKTQVNVLQNAAAAQLWLSSMSFDEDFKNIDVVKKLYGQVRVYTL